MKTYEKMVAEVSRKDRTGIALNYNKKRWEELGIGSEESKLFAKTSKSIRKFLEERDNQNLDMDMELDERE